MSTLWTPGGERPASPPQREPGRPQAPPASDASGGEPRPPLEAGDELAEEQLTAEMAEAQRQLLDAPAATVVANHCIGLFHLAALHLNQPEPKLDEAQVAIDAFAGVVESLGPRLGEDAASLRDALNQLRMAFVQRKGSAGG